MMTTEQKNIKYKIFRGEQANQILLCLHGFAGDKESSVVDAIGLSLQKDHITTIAFDLPCHGEDQTKGSFSLERCREYLVDVVEQISKYKMPINIFATSFGAYLYLRFLAEKQDFKNVILRSPAVDMHNIIFKIIKEHDYSVEDLKTKTLNLGYGRELLIDKQFVASLKLPQISKQNSNFINIIQGKKDELIDCEFNERYFEKYFPNNHRFHYFAQADHRYKNPGEKEKIVEIVRSILLEK